MCNVLIQHHLQAWHGYCSVKTRGQGLDSALIWTIIKSLTFVFMLVNFHVLTDVLSASLLSHGLSVQLRSAHGPPQLQDLWTSGASNRLQIHEGGEAVWAAPHGQKEGGVRLVPTAQGLLRHDPQAALHGSVQVPNTAPKCWCLFRPYLRLCLAS